MREYFANIAEQARLQQMSPALRVILVIVSFLLVILVLKKIRKKQLHIDDALYWMVSSFLLLIVSIFPQLAFWASAILQIKDPTNFVFLFVIFIVLVKLFKIAIDLSVQKQRLNRLVQNLALANEEIEQNKKNIENQKKEINKV